MKSIKGAADTEHKSITSDTVKRIYQERSDNIIIGLTGRTGSGCSTIAEILSTEDFEELSLREPKKKDYRDSDERKYNVVYNYIESNWGKFTIIRMTHIISYYIFTKDYEDFIQYLKRLDDCDGCSIPEFKSLENKLSELKNDFNNIHKNLKDEMLQHEIPNLTKKLKETLKKYVYKYEEKDIEEKTKKEIHSQLYTYLFQDIGNNIRSSGDPYDKTIRSENIFALAKKADQLIQILKENNGGNGLFCVNALRNPYEVTYLKDKYASFYLFSINTEDENREQRLNHLDATEMKSLDDKEYPKEEDFIHNYFHQNIRMCIELSDIHIYNPNMPDGAFYFLTEQLVKYIALIKHPGLITPTRVERCMQLAYNAKLNSGCLSRQVGAVITDADYSTKAVGWNDVPEGQIPCNLRDVCSFCKNKDSESYSFFERTNKKFSTLLNKINKTISVKNKDLNGRMYPYCFKDIYNTINNNRDRSYTRSLHAEENAFLQIAKYGGEGIKGGNLFTTASSCELCSKKAFQLGIRKIYYIDPYPGISKSHILDFGNDMNRRPQMILFNGAIGSAYTTLYMQRVAYKDELTLLTNIDYPSEWESCRKKTDEEQ